MSEKKKSSKKRRFADFQTKYRRSLNFGYGSKRDRFAIAGNGELQMPEKDDNEERES
ncbi:hypothetical protein [Aquimarina spongiae]|uniref:Uncharacterized protein n=1 Tax=Aquimarina spongiae TaxID=570521 RepID=A0A1M6B893_9FLAO|nr:hypothetical protein [Aquimarina spongiae]SHI44942.1 hypothetical protein SAMN04488508_101680 [Aquimarina spongiae]